MTKHILIIEDDAIQSAELTHRLERFGFEFHRISTELNFRKHLKEGYSTSYSLAIVDMMLRWTDPGPAMEMPPPEIIQEGFYTGGLRCCRALAARGVSCVIFTALDPERIPLQHGENFPIINKSTGYARLLQIIQYL